MDRNELVEKAARAMYEYSPYATWAYEDWDAVDPKDEWRDMATAAVDAILPDVIEAVREEAAWIAEGGIDPAFDRELGASWQRSKIAAAIRAAVLGDAPEGGI